jgi:hypothetical protein
MPAVWVSHRLEVLFGPLIPAISASRGAEHAQHHLMISLRLTPADAGLSPRAVTDISQRVTGRRFTERELLKVFTRLGWLTTLENGRYFFWCPELRLPGTPPEKFFDILEDEMRRAA